MASPANFLRLCLRPSRRLPTLRIAALQQPVLHRPLSTTQWRSAAADENAGKEEAEDEINEVFNNPGQYLSSFLRDEKITEEERQLATRMLEDWQKVPPNMRKTIEKLTEEITDASAPLRRPVVPKRDSFWNSEEPDTDLITDEVGEDDFEEDDIMAMGHAKLEEHREFREYARIAVWEMPLLSKLAKPFQPPTEEQVLRFRYTTYMGEFHPADRKVVVEFCPKDLPGLTEAQQLKLKKLAGARYNPEKDIIKMSCEKFEHQAQNKRYLGDLVNKMIETAKDPSDMFEDIPLDTRHHKFKQQIKFPKEWLLTEERKKELHEQRKQALLLDEAKRTEGSLIDGVETIQQALLHAKVEEAVPVLRGRSGRGRR
ncbi:mitochondrial ribosomal subunit protein-domain-containing protein [Corynascus novoguineensis]|uniref:Mitochondrial ribosomal subunit protein-domain-containing protein n=1 Tax=Corynascus novoguineensis TaxID=1126955 RepID=A0AAN7CYP7_9PEZI|nr:mitochondrial ribosomal subunit protein-domain-containing protein [Corynascus novoguineensis]